MHLKRVFKRVVKGYYTHVTRAFCVSFYLLYTLQIDAPRAFLMSLFWVCVDGILIVFSATHVSRASILKY